MEKPVIIVLVGVTGDLAKRKLLPALETIGSEEKLPTHFKVVGITRQEGIDLESLLPNMPWLHDKLEIFSMDVTQENEYQRLSKRLQEIEEEFAQQAQRLFYLSVPPDASKTVIGMLGNSGLAGIPDTKLLIEKPFGSDYASAKDLLEFISQHFSPEQVFRIDHYLAKEFARNFALWREGNEIPKYDWNSDHIEKIQILASEKIGIENRANFYEQTGALRDLVQSHLLQMAALALMTTHGSIEEIDLPQRRLAALKQLHMPQDKPIEEVVKLGQYEGYREEVKNPESMMETYVSLTLASDDPTWKGMPITLTTGKNLDKKLTEIRATYKVGKSPNPDPEIAFQDNPSGTTRGSEAYEKVFFDAIAGDQTFFVSAPEILECWRIIKPVLEYRRKLLIYKPGSRPVDLTNGSI
jgi:glucose-6-phosphate 1-dehydrogenase